MALTETLLAGHTGEEIGVTTSVQGQDTLQSHRQTVASLWLPGSSAPLLTSALSEQFPGSGGSRVDPALEAPSELLSLSSGREASAPRASSVSQGRLSVKEKQI